MFEVLNISKKFNDVMILDNTSVIIKSSTVQFLTGRSGTGKTTFLKILAGLENYIDSNNATTCVTIDKIIYVPQVNSLWNNLRVKENILLYRKQILNETERVALDKCKWLFEELNITHILDRFPAKLSSGEHQRVALARALASGKEIILLDEITANLDFENKEIIKNIILKATKMGMAFFIISHDLQFISTFVDECLVLENGILSLINITTYASSKRFTTV